MSNAPDLPHLNRHFAHHGPSGVLTVRIDRQAFTHDGLVMLSGVCVEGSETYETGYIKDCRGEQISVFVTESQYMRLSNAPLP
ncbi:hypothetical protein ACX40Y_09585 [Sphingomonas sp. RS6]